MREYKNKYEKLLNKYEKLLKEKDILKEQYLIYKYRHQDFLNNGSKNFKCLKCNTEIKKKNIKKTKNCLVCHIEMEKRGLCFKCKNKIEQDKKKYLVLKNNN